MWLDFGTGGGFPGLVLAILARHLSPDLRFSLVESDRRKCSFLKRVSRDLTLSVDIMNSRVESIELEKTDYVSARAVTQLNDLLFLVRNVVSRETEEALNHFKNLVIEWNPTINLVSKNSISE